MDDWLKSKLIEMDLDESVYLPFIKTILEDDAMDGEAKSAEIKDYIGDLPNIEEFVTSVLDQWRSAKATKNNANTAKKSVKSLGETLNELNILTPEDMAEKKPVNKLSDAEKRAILSQYSYVSEGLSDEEDGEDNSQEEDLSHFKLDSLPEDPFADTNPNRAAAKQEELAKREQMKQDHLKKVEEKKLAREKFKAEKARKEEERKKSAVKQERRR